MSGPALRGSIAAAPEAGAAAFGSYALPPFHERLRRFGQSMGRGAIARRACSVIRRIVSAGRAGPFDVEAFPGQHARLYPSENLTDKRVFSGVQFWDWAERAALGRVVRAADEPVYVVDAGANAGLYSLAIRAEAGAKALQIVAIEPDPENLARLRFNVDASGATEAIVPVAVALSDAVGTAHLSPGHANRGELALAEIGTEVALRPLIDVVREAGFPRIDALKLDIEGHEERVLRHFLDHAPAALRPGLVILEARRGEETPALALLRQADYVAVERTKMNIILRHDAGHQT